MLGWSDGYWIMYWAWTRNPWFNSWWNLVFDSTLVDSVTTLNKGVIFYMGHLEANRKFHKHISRETLNQRLCRPILHTLKTGQGTWRVPAKIEKNKMPEKLPCRIFFTEDWEEYIPEPPDGGWGWVVMIASFFNNFILDGIAYCFGIFLRDYVNSLNTTVGNATLANSLLCGVYSLVGE